MQIAQINNKLMYLDYAFVYTKKISWKINICNSEHQIQQTPDNWSSVLSGIVKK